MTMVMTMVVINSDCSRNFCLLASTRGLFYRPFERMGLENCKRNAEAGRGVMMEAVDLIPLALSGRFDPKVGRTKQ